MGETAKIEIEGKTYEFPVVVGTENEKGIDIRTLRDKTGYITLDPGYPNTGSCLSGITYIDGEKGILRYRGIPIEDLAEKSDFVEVSYLLIYGHLPTKKERAWFSNGLTRHSLIHEDLLRILSDLPPNTHPMATLSAVVCAMSAYYPQFLDPDLSKDKVDALILSMLSKVRTIAAFAYKKSIGQPIIYPKNEVSYCGNFLRMMYGVPAEPFVVDPDLEKVMNLLLILHADHEQNCSTSTVRLVGSSRANLFASLSAAILALWGPLHGGANQKVIEMLELIQAEGGNYKKFMELAKDKNSSFKLFGFGHRVYKNYDPRAKIIKNACDLVLKKLGVDDPILDIAKNLEKIALEDSYFIERKLYPNVDFYSGIIYRAMGIPVNMFTVMFALGRLPGWIAQWKEMIEENAKIGRPRQIYVGNVKSPYVPTDQRK